MVKGGNSLVVPINESVKDTATVTKVGPTNSWQYHVSSRVGLASLHAFEKGSLSELPLEKFPLMFTWDSPEDSTLTPAMAHNCSVVLPCSTAMFDPAEPPPAGRSALLHWVVLGIGLGGSH